MLSLVSCASNRISDSETDRLASEQFVETFSTACLDLYPKNDGSLEQWLDRPGVKLLAYEDRIVSTVLSDTEYLIIGPVLYSLIYSEINLCTLRARYISQELVNRDFEILRAGIKSTGATETLTVNDTRSGLLEHYRYENDGNFVYRIDLTFTSQGFTLLSTVSDLRSRNL